MILSLLFLLFISSPFIHCSKNIPVEITKDDEYLVQIQTPRGNADLDILVKLGLNIDHPRGDKTLTQAYIDSSDQLQKLTDLGFSYLPVSLPTRHARAESWRRDENESGFTTRQDPKGTNPWVWNIHHNYNLMVQLLQEVHSKYPNITRLFSIGQSIQGRDLWMIELSDNPGVNEPGEPEFKYVANMHGDEVVGRELVLHLIVEMCETYYSDRENPADGLWSRSNIRRLIDNTDIFLMPTMNPDGYERASRYNANNKDLNRSFPDRVDGPLDEHDDGQGSDDDYHDNDGFEKEVMVMMNWISSKNFILSANFHGGEVVANYPWDGNFPHISGLYTGTQDDELFKNLALTYSRSHSSMYKSRAFTNGITNGAEWYVLYGGMQDWNYWKKGCFELTLEVSTIKTPRATSLPAYWEENRVSLIAYMQLVHTGIKGFVRRQNDANGENDFGHAGDGLDAVITIEGNKDHVLRTDPEWGDYYRLLAPRSTPYKLIVSALGRNQTYEFYITEQQPLVVHDFYF
eukprot:TRINITY_DN2213_c0_g1_i1.p1 TRINITY_DN2213_c0_g1~~TRINITY_DN2213_c0_g1_i1.p1  ORF type:complete len:517 (-),score=97.54 TRINITY_DN2213_c0_g1_i1:149-1699(-)